MEKDPFKEYLKESEPDKSYKGYAWSTAIGLQAVDGLKPSKYLIDTAIKNIEGKITIKEAQSLINSYYERRTERLFDDERTEEADKVSSRIAEILSETAFTFSPNEYIAMHRKLFQGIYKHAGKIRDYNITKNGCLMVQLLCTAVFFIKYLRTLGFSATNDIFAENAWYFRNALVRANYTNLQKGIYEKSNNFSAKTTIHIHRLFEKFGFDKVFGRSAVMEVLELKGSGASKLLSNLVQADIIEPVLGHGKGKYKFKE